MTKSVAENEIIVVAPTKRLTAAHFELEGTVDRVYCMCIAVAFASNSEIEIRGRASWRSSAGRLDLPYRVSGRMGRQDSGLASTADPYLWSADHFAGFMDVLNSSDPDLFKFSCGLPGKRLVRTDSCEFLDFEGGLSTYDDNAPRKDPDKRCLERYFQLL